MSKPCVINTICLQVSADQPDSEAITEAATILRRGGLVAFPTETVYGLGADAFNSSAIRKVFEAKGRPSDNPLIVHIAELSCLDSLTASFPEIAQTLARKFWPGPLTLILRRTSKVPDIVSPGLDTVAVRMPNHPVALSLLRRFGRGLVAPSANISGRPSPTTAQHVLDDLEGLIEMVLDSGPTEIGVESTVLDITVSPPAILRKGGLSREAIEAAIGPVNTEADSALTKRSPGNRYKHYAPHAKVVLVATGDVLALATALHNPDFVDKKIACLLHSIPAPAPKSNVTVQRAPLDLGKFSHSLFEYLRQSDKAGIDIIIVEEVSEVGLGAAVMDRLRRATSSVEGN